MTEGVAVDGPAPARRTGGGALMVVPTYNEAATIRPLLDGLRRHAPEGHVLVVDDASPDGTGGIVAAEAADPRVHLLPRDRKQGLGNAYRAGFAWGLARGYGALGAMDADLSHDPAAVPGLVAGLASADLVVGSRYVPGGRVEGWPRRRHALSVAGNVYARALTGVPVRDATSGFRVFRACVLEHIDPAGLESDGYAFQVETALRAHRAGFRVVEHPIVFTERTAGDSKLSRAVVAEAAWRVPVWAVRGRRRRHGQAVARSAPRGARR